MAALAYFEAAAEKVVEIGNIKVARSLPTQDE